MDALVFDFDGLILDTETSAYTTAAEVFETYGIDLDLEWWHTILGSAEHPHWSEVLEEALGHEIPDREAVLLDRLERHHKLVEAEVVRPGVEELAGAADAAGITCAVASSSTRAWVHDNLVRLGLRDHFAALCCRDDVAEGRTKPAPDLYLIACAMVDAEPARSVALEDSPNGVAAARAAGLSVVAVPGGMTATLDVSAADLVVPSLRDVDLARLERLIPAG